MLTFKQFLQEAKFNKGDVAEVVLGAAMVSKFRKTDDSAVTEDEVEQVIRKVMEKENIKYQRRDKQDEDKDEQERIFDKITFRVGVPKAATEFLKGEDLSEIVELFQSAVEYVNTNKRLIRQAKVLRSNAKVDEIIVNSDGTGDQKGTKADIKLTINGEKTRNQISLKITGGEQFAQVSGAGFNKQVSLWEDGLGLKIGSLEKTYNKAMENFEPGLKFASREDEFAEEQKQIVKKATGLVYKEAANKLNKLFDSKDKEFLEGLVNFISEGIAKDEQQYIELVKLEKGTFKNLRPDSRKFRNFVHNLDLQAEFKGGSSDPSLIIKDKESGKPLIQIRAKIELQSSKTKEGKTYKVYPRNLIEAPKDSILYSL